MENDSDRPEALFKIRVNGRERVMPRDATLPLSVREALTILGYPGRHFAVAVNLHFVARGLYETTQLKNGDSLEIVSPMQGG